MPRPDGREVTTIKRSDLAHPEPLGDGDDGCVGGTEREVGVDPLLPLVAALAVVVRWLAPMLPRRLHRPGRAGALVGTTVVLPVLAGS